MLKGLIGTQLQAACEEAVHHLQVQKEQGRRRLSAPVLLIDDQAGCLGREPKRLVESTAQWRGKYPEEPHQSPLARNPPAFGLSQPLRINRRRRERFFHRWSDRRAIQKFWIQGVCPLSRQFEQFFKVSQGLIASLIILIWRYRIKIAYGSADVRERGFAGAINEVGYFGLRCKIMSKSSRTQKGSRLEPFLIHRFRLSCDFAFWGCRAQCSRISRLQCQLSRQQVSDCAKTELERGLGKSDGLHAIAALAGISPIFANRVSKSVRKLFGILDDSAWRYSIGLHPPGGSHIKTYFARQHSDSPAGLSDTLIVACRAASPDAAEAQQAPGSTRRRDALAPPCRSRPRRSSKSCRSRRPMITC